MVNVLKIAENASMEKSAKLNNQYFVLVKLENQPISKLSLKLENIDNLHKI